MAFACAFLGFWVIVKEMPKVESEAVMSDRLRGLDNCLSEL
jgi:hypothetical protein